MSAQRLTPCRAISVRPRSASTSGLPGTSHPRRAATAAARSSAGRPGRSLVRISRKREEKKWQWRRRVSRPRLQGQRLSRELVAHPVNGEDVLRVARVGLDLLAQPGHVHVDGARRRHRVVAPHLVEQLLARERRAAVLDEVAQQLELPRRQLDRLAAWSSPPAEVDPDIAELIALGRMRVPRARGAAWPRCGRAARPSRTASSRSRPRRASARRPCRRSARARSA